MKNIFLFLFLFSLSFLSGEDAQGRHLPQQFDEKLSAVVEYLDPDHYLNSIMCMKKQDEILIKRRKRNFCLDEENKFADQQKRMNRGKGGQVHMATPSDT